VVRSAKAKRRSFKAVDWFQIFSKTDVQELLRRAEAYGDVQGHAVIMTMARTGIRISEMLGPQVGDLDFERREIAVQRTWGNTSRGPGCFGIPKGGELRIVDMSRQVADVLASYLCQRTLESVWLFAGKADIPNKPNNFYAVHWNKLFHDHDFLRRRHPHALRHRYASEMLRRGEPVQYIKEQLGHSSITITVGLYGHFIPNPNKQAVDALDDPGSEFASQRKSGASSEKNGLRLVKN
jgi:integrase